MTTHGSSQKHKLSHVAQKDADWVDDGMAVGINLR